MTWESRSYEGTGTWPDYLANGADQKNQGPFGGKKCTEIEISGQLTRPRVNCPCAPASPPLRAQSGNQIQTLREVYICVYYHLWMRCCMSSYCMSSTKCVAVCCSVLQCVAVCCSVLQYVISIWWMTYNTMTYNTSSTEMTHCVRFIYIYTYMYIHFSPVSRWDFWNLKKYPHRPIYTYLYAYIYIHTCIPTNAWGFSRQKNKKCTAHVYVYIFIFLDFLPLSRWGVLRPQKMYAAGFSDVFAECDGGRDYVCAHAACDYV